MLTNSQARFEAVHPLTAQFEGGWSDHAQDPGGKTMYGVTQGKYHEWLRKNGRKVRPVRNITKAEALEIYKNEYWDPLVERYNLVPGVDRVTYDAGVNSGIGRGRKWLLASVGSSDPSVTVRRICRARLSFMQSLRIWKTFGRGWGRRVAAMEAKGVAEAIAYHKASDPNKDAVKAKTLEVAAVEANDAVKQKKAAEGKAAGAGAGAGSGVGADQLDPTLFGDWAPYVLGAIIILAGIIIVGTLAQSRAQKAREEAYLKLKSEVLS